MTPLVYKTLTTAVIITTVFLAVSQFDVYLEETHAITGYQKNFSACAVLIDIRRVAHGVALFLALVSCEAVIKNYCIFIYPDTSYQYELQHNKVHRCYGVLRRADLYPLSRDCLFLIWKDIGGGW